MLCVVICSYVRNRKKKYYCIIAQARIVKILKEKYYKGKGDKILFNIIMFTNDSQKKKIPSQALFLQISSTYRTSYCYSRLPCYFKVV